MKFWRKYTQQEMDEKITESLEKTLNYDNTKTIGIPGTKLDDTVFYDDHSFVKHSPYLRTFIQNPNHIGCHTYDKADILFGGTFDIERELIQLLAIDVLNGNDEEFDGYVTQGGTEANIQAMWVYRNYFKKERKAKHEEIAIITSADTHYSAYKGSDLLNIDIIKVPVDFYSRKIQENTLDSIVKEAKEIGKKYFIVISNMGTTMFGSVDDPDLYANIFDKYNLEYKIHVDGAFGGFQAPYGTGIFVSRKNLIHNTLTKEATYIENLDVTLSGSRSGSNAVAIWMVLASYGPYGWMEKINKLRNRTKWLCKQLNDMRIKYYKEDSMNIVTIEEQYVNKEIAEKYFLVPEVHNPTNNWYKIVVMEHVELDILNSLVYDLRKFNKEHLKAM